MYNSEVAKKASKKWRDKNKYKCKEYNKKWREKNQDKVKRWNKKYRESHPLKHVIDKHKRRARERKAEGAFSQEEWRNLLIKHKNRCAFCKLEIKLTVDHILSLARGGTNYISNIQPLCMKCNLKKGIY